MTTLLHVEDDDALAGVVERNVSDLVHAVVRARTAAEGLSALRSFRVDVILWDLRMPDTGTTVLEHIGALERVCLLAEARGVRVVVLTGLSHPHLHELCVDAGASGFLDKRAGRDKIRAVIRLALGQRMVAHLGQAMVAGIMDETARLQAAYGAGL